MSDNGNGNERAWGQIKEVDRTLMDVGRSAYAPLFTELSLRLEQTSPTKCLAVPFTSSGDAERAAADLQKLFRKTNPREISLVVCEVDDDSTLLLAGWAKRKGKGLKGVCRSRRKVTDDYEE